MRRLTLFSTMVLFTAFVSISAASTAGTLRVGMNLPAGQFQDLRGNQVKIPEITRGKVTVIHFWALGCSSCREEMPAMDALYRKLRPKGFEIFAINSGQRKADIEIFARENGISYTILLDPDRKSTQLYEVAGIPRTLILDRNGTIRFKIIGVTPPELLRKYVTSLLDS